MSTCYWLGIATAVAQVSKITFGTYDVTTTRKITIGGIVVSAADSGGTLTTALTALAALLNASTHPYFAAITWSSTATEIIGTADTPGSGFVMTGSVTGGTGTVSASGVMSTTTANAGPNDWSTATNWSGGAVPVAGDNVIIRDNAVNICQGLDQSAVALASVTIMKSYTGKIGLKKLIFAQSSDGITTYVSTAQEYRDDYLKIDPTTLRLGEHYGAGAPTGSGRIKIDLGSAHAQTVFVTDTCAVSTDAPLPAVRFKAAHASTAFYIKGAPAGVGIAVDMPGETSTVGSVNVSDPGSTAKVVCGPGVTLTTWTQQGGSNILQAAATVTTVTVNGGTLQIEGDYTITTMNANGGTIIDNHFKTGGNAITTLNIQGGAVDAQQSLFARTFATVGFFKGGGALKADGSVLTITTLNDYSGKYTLTGT